MTRSHSARRLSSTLTAVMTLAFTYGLAGVAQAEPPQGAFYNPSAAGPGNIISSKPDGIDSRYHFVVRANANPANPDRQVQSVQIQIRSSGDASATWVTIGNATRVAGTDVWELFWDLASYPNQAHVDNDAGDVRALISDGTETNFVPAETGMPVSFRDQAAETVEITYPTNGGPIGMHAGGARISGTASADTTLVRLYRSSTGPGTEPTWTECGTASAFETQPNGTQTWSGTCSGVDNTLTAVAARAFSGASGATAASGDAHRAAPYDQTAQSVQIQPVTDNQTIGFCNTYTARVVDTQGAPMLGATVDVHASGPDDSLQFAVNSGVEGDESDPFTAPAGGPHTYEAAGGCDQAESNTIPPTPEPDGRPDDYDSTNEGDGSPAAGEAGAEGVHVESGPDIKHIRGATTATTHGFRFSIAFQNQAATGATTITAWFDANNNNELDTGEPSGNASKNWQGADINTLNATPEDDANRVGMQHTVTGRVTDQNGNPVSGVPLHFRVMSGPHSDNDLDASPTTPGGYFGSCSTGPDGRCSRNYVGTETGTDTIAVFRDNVTANLTPDPAEMRDNVTKLWYPTFVGNVCLDLDPNNDTNEPDETHTLVAFVTDGSFSSAGDTADERGQVDNDCSGDPVFGAEVTFTITDNTPPNRYVESGTTTYVAVTNAAGRAEATVDNVNDQPGDNTYQAEVTNGVATARTANKQWSQRGVAAAIDCEPELDMKATGQQASVTATVTDAFGDPVEDAPVDMHVRSTSSTNHDDQDLDGNASTPLGYFLNDGRTNAEGKVTGTYTGSTAGRDDIDCWADHNQNFAIEAGEPNDPVEKRWRTPQELAASHIRIDMRPGTEAGGVTNEQGDRTEPGTTNGKACDATTTDLTHASWNNTDNDAVNSVNLVCVTARTSESGTGETLVGATVTLTSTGVGVITDNNGPPPSVTTQTAMIGTDGYARFYLFSTRVGTQTVTASIEGVTDTDAGTQNWYVLSAEARNINCLPASTTTEAGEEQQIVCTVTDGLENPIQGIGINWTKQDTSGASSEFVNQQNSTDENGEARATVRSNEEGTTTVTATMQGTTECSAAAGQPHTGGNSPNSLTGDNNDRSWDTGKPAGTCADSSQVNWDEQQPPPPGRRCPGLSHVRGNHVVGTNRNNVLVGTRGRDVICGRGGNDEIRGVGGEDLLQGGSGRDNIKGGSGNDRIFGDSGADRLDGNAGDDRAYGGGGADRFVGGAGHDRMYGQGGQDVLLGSTGNDRLFGGGGNDDVRGQGGNDLVYGQSGDDALRGSGGNDTLRGGRADDLLLGGGGSDRHIGGQGFDTCRDDRGSNSFRNCEA